VPRTEPTVADEELRREEIRAKLKRDREEQQLTDKLRDAARQNGVIEINSYQAAQLFEWKEELDRLRPLEREARWKLATAEREIEDLRWKVWSAGARAERIRQSAPGARSKGADRSLADILADEDLYPSSADRTHFRDLKAGLWWCWLAGAHGLYRVDSPDRYHFTVVSPPPDLADLERYPDEKVPGETVFLPVEEKDGVPEKARRALILERFFQCETESETRDGDSFRTFKPVCNLIDAGRKALEQAWKDPGLRLPGYPLVPLDRWPEGISDTTMQRATLKIPTFETDEQSTAEQKRAAWLGVTKSLTSAQTAEESLLEAIVRALRAAGKRDEAQRLRDEGWRAYRREVTDGIGSD
jgi:hypothetical protein